MSRESLTFTSDVSVSVTRACNSDVRFLVQSSLILNYCIIKIKCERRQRLTISRHCYGYDYIAQLYLF